MREHLHIAYIPTLS